MVKIDFECDTKFGRYKDALYLPVDHQFTDAEIEAMKQERADNWVSFIEAQSEVTESPTEE